MQIHNLGNFKNCYFLSIAKFSIYLVLYFESSIVKSVINNSENLANLLQYNSPSSP